MVTAVPILFMEAEKVAVMDSKLAMVFTKTVCILDWFTVNSCRSQRQSRMFRRYFYDSGRLVALPQILRHERTHFWGVSLASAFDPKYEQNPITHVLDANSRWRARKTKVAKANHPSRREGKCENVSLVLFRSSLEMRLR